MRRFDRRAGCGCLGLLALMLLLLCARTPGLTPVKELGIPVTVRVTIQNSSLEASSLEDADLTATAAARQPLSTPSIVPTPLPQPTITPPPATPASTVRQPANLRAGPGTNYPITGSARAGQVLQIIARNAGGDWLQLSDQTWISAGLVANPSASLPVAQGSAAQPLAPPTQATASSSGPLRVHVIDVGQGDAILVQSPDGHNALIDAGDPGSGAFAYLKGQGVTRLDLVVFTHPNADRIGGLPEVLNAIPAGLVIASGQPQNTPPYEQLIDTIDARKIPYREVKRGDKLPLGNVSLEVLSPAQTQPTGDLNDNSVVTRLIYGQTVFQFEGDATQNAENRMRSAGVLVPVTVLKIGHHGSKDASGLAFLKALKPTFAVYTAGLGNSYGHPTAQVIANLQAVGAEIHGTDREGTILLTSDGKAVTVSTANKAAPILVPLAPPVKIAPTVAAAPRTNCDPAYPDVCIPSPPPDLDCGDITHRRFRVLPPDPHRFDGDHDGIGCES